MVWAGSAVSDYLDPAAGRPSMLLLTAIFLGSAAWYLVRRRAGRAWTMQPVLEEGAEADAKAEPAAARPPPMTVQT